MRAIKIAVEALGSLATLAVLMFFAFTKGGPGWYLPLFLASAAVLYAGTIIYLLLGRVIWQTVDRADWSITFKPFILGSFFATSVIGIVLVAARAAK
jgi:hypothetical protein